LNQSLKLISTNQEHIETKKANHYNYDKFDCIDLDPNELVNYINKFKLRARLGQLKTHTHIELMLFMNLKASRLNYMSKLDEIKLKSSSSPLQMLTAMTTHIDTSPPQPQASPLLSSPLSISSSSASNSSYSSGQRLESSNVLELETQSNFDRLGETKPNSDPNRFEKIKPDQKIYEDEKEQTSNDDTNNLRNDGSVKAVSAILLNYKKFNSADNLNVASKSSLSKSSLKPPSTNFIDQIKSSSTDNFSGSSRAEPTQYTAELVSKKPLSAQKLSKQAAVVTDRLYNRAQLTKTPIRTVVNLNAKQTGLKRKITEKGMTQIRQNQIVRNMLLEKNQVALLTNITHNLDLEHNADSDTMMVSQLPTATSLLNEDEKTKQLTNFSNNKNNSTSESKNTGISQHEVQTQNLIIPVKRNKSADKISQYLAENK
jgi:hypothetical protein